MTSVVSELPRGFRGCQEIIPEPQSRGSSVCLWKKVLEERQRGACGGLGAPCPSLVAEHKILAGSLQDSRVCGGSWGRLWWLWQQ